MKKIIAFEWLSLDGFLADRHESTDWFVWDEEVGDYAKKVQNKSGTLLFGRITYEIMARYWPTESAAANEDPAITQFMNETPKTVFSKTLSPNDPLVLAWGNTTIINEITTVGVNGIKKKANKNILIYGSGSIVSQLTKLGVLDDYEIMINPVVLGSGKPMFQNIEEKLTLKLTRVKRFKCGNTMLTFRHNT